MGPLPAAVSSSYIKSLLAARCRSNASSSSSRAGGAKLSSGGVVKRRYKRRRRRRRAPATRAAKPAARRAKPKPKTAEMAIQTTDYGQDGDDIQMNVSVGTSNSARDRKATKKEEKLDIFGESSKTKKKVVKKEVKTEVKAEKKPSILDVITLSDDEDDVKPVVIKPKKMPQPSDDGPSTSRGTGGGEKAVRRRARVMDSSDDEDYVPEPEEAVPLRAKKRLSTRSNKDLPATVGAATSSSAVAQSGTKTAEAAVVVVDPQREEQDRQLRVQMVHDFLFTPPIAAAIAKNLPMKSLNSLSQVNPLLRDICRIERIKPRRQSFDWFLRPSIVSVLDGDRMQTEQRIFGRLISELYCEPDLIIAFCSPSVLYGHRLNFDGPRSRHKGEFKLLHDVLGDLMPANIATTGSTKIVHVRTHGVMPPLPVKTPLSANPRKADEYGCKESPRDFCLLCIPKIQGVNMWREYLTAAQLRKQLRDSGWLEHRSETHFLLPVIKDLEPLSPKLVMIFSRRRANFDHVAAADFPVIVLNTMDDYTGMQPVRDADYGLEWLSFGGNVTAFQVFIKGSAGRLGRSHQIRRLRDQFTASQVMGGRIMLFYFRNVTKFETANATEQSELMEGDIIQLREEFPRVPIFGGGYQNVIGSCFIKDKTAADFGKFWSGLHSAFVCGVVLGGQ
ncbi:hypothetical protein BV898_06824 [Hypsibius exemplaris]|uniref:Uncharacterized protein n=1 Tax=Hypsibius exemplaris TaxID=2072580 RepID=A0A1W0WVK6_HYPEX|nr:hypothetical protein BV898_06824 [Hypsibius exemplaris]